MIEFHYEVDFSIENTKYYTDWLSRLIMSENGTCRQLDFIFCSDDYLLAINQKYLKHDTLTDIISFDYSEGKYIAGDIFISVDRLKDNAKIYRTDLENELLRVMAHGVLHLLGFKDKSEGDLKVMRAKEEEKIKMFHVEQ